MTDDIRQGVDKIIMLHVDSIQEAGASAEKTTVMVNNLAKLYSLRQKDDAEENRHDEAKDKLAYDNGRADLELSVKEHQFKLDDNKHELEQERLNFERERFQCELAVKEEANEIERKKLQQGKVGQFLQAATAAAGTVFNLWLSSNVMKLEETGVVGSFIAKKVFGSMLGKQKTEL